MKWFILLDYLKFTFYGVHFVLASIPAPNVESSFLSCDIFYPALVLYHSALPYNPVKVLIY